MIATKNIIIIFIVVFVVLVTFMFSLKSDKDLNNGLNISTPNDSAVAYFAGGCFWCVESDIEKLSSVYEVISGYAGGGEENPTYKQVSSGSTGHRESVKVLYDSDKLSYGELVEYFLRHIDPTDDGGSFYDRGHQYTSAVYYTKEEEKNTVKKVIQSLEENNVFPNSIKTAVEPLGVFWEAEDYHQDYYKKNPIRYKYYRSGSGRDDYIKNIKDNETSKVEAGDNIPEFKNGFWRGFQKPSDAELKKLLTSLQYEVTQKNKTERPFENKYNDNKEKGIYVDVVSGEPLFSSTHKYESGTGWPSFWQPLVPENVIKKEDFLLIIPRTEIRSKYADSHLGHVFKDGPAPTGLRYCMNSAALRFVPKDQMQEEGYEVYLYLFDK